MLLADQAPGEPLFDDVFGAPFGHPATVSSPRWRWGCNSRYSVDMDDRIEQA
jgi:hypothetical protein